MKENITSLQLFWLGYNLGKGIIKQVELQEELNSINKQAIRMLNLGIDLTLLIIGKQC